MATIASKSISSITTLDEIAIAAPSSIAEGDLLIFFYGINDATDSIQTLSGWTHALNMQVVGSNVYCGLQWKIAEVADESVGTYHFNCTGTAVLGGFMLRITDYLDEDLLNFDNASVSNDETPSFANTVTPATADSLLLFFTVASTLGTAGMSGYAITTNNPTWTEEYDVNSGSTWGMSLASASRPETTATGNSSLTAGTDSNLDSVGVMIAIGTPTDVSVGLDTAGILTLSQGGSHTLNFDYTTNVGVGTLTMSGNEVTSDTTENAVYSGDSKPTTNWTNLSK